MSISKKTLKKIVESITSWADELSYPIPPAQLHSDWLSHLESELEKHQIPSPLSNINIERVKSATIDQYHEYNKEAVTRHLNTIISSALETISSKSPTITTLAEFLQFVSDTSNSFKTQIRSESNEYLGFSKEYQGLEKFQKNFEESLIETIKISVPHYFNEVDRVMMELINKDLHAFNETLTDLLRKSIKAQKTEVLGAIEVGVEKITKKLKSEYSVFPEFWLNYYKNYFTNWINKEWVKRRNEEFGLLHSNFKEFLLNVIQKIKNKELIAFDRSICSLQVREAVAEVVLAYIPDEVTFPCLILDNFINALQLPSSHLTSNYLRNNAAIDQSVEKFLSNSDQISRFFSIICIVLLLSNTYNFLTEKIINKEVYSPYFRQVVRMSVNKLFQVNYDNVLENKPKFDQWSLVLLCEQEVENGSPGWNVEKENTQMLEYIKENYDLNERNCADRLEDYSEEQTSTFLRGVLRITSKIINTVVPTKRIKEFTLERIKEVNSLSTTIVISGWLSKEDNMNDSWHNITKNDLQGHTLALKWDSGSTKELVKKDMLPSAFLSLAFLVSPTVIKAAEIGLLYAVSPFKKRARKAETTGYVLADLIHSKVFGNACISLVGFSLGTRVIYFCLQRLQELGSQVHDVLLLGGAAPLNGDAWKKCRKNVAGRFINAYSKTDLILSKMYTLSRLEKAVGNYPLEVEGVENFDVTEIATGHLKYRDSLGEILDKVGYYLE